MRFYKGAELDKQIYKEGESSWGLKQGFLDVEDIINFIKEGDKMFYSKYYGDDNVNNGEYNYAVKLWDEFKELAGSKLTLLTERGGKGK